MYYFQPFTEDNITSNHRKFNEFLSLKVGVLSLYCVFDEKLEKMFKNLF
jgi:hypothetical protein